MSLYSLPSRQLTSSPSACRALEYCSALARSCLPLGLCPPSRGKMEPGKHRGVLRLERQVCDASGVPGVVYPAGFATAAAGESQARDLLIALDFNTGTLGLGPTAVRVLQRAWGSTAGKKGNRSRVQPEPCWAIQEQSWPRVPVQPTLAWIPALALPGCPVVWRLRERGEVPRVASTIVDPCGLDDEPCKEGM